MPEKRSDDSRIIKIGEKLRRIRIERGYTSYTAFADENGLEKTQYWRLERGIGFTLKSLLLVLDIHQISLYEFFSDDEFK